MTLDPKEMKHGQRVWIAVDLDGTLAKRTSGDSLDTIGEPIPQMVDRVRMWLAQGWMIGIFTARASMPRAGAWTQQANMIIEWMKKHVADTDQDWFITCEKDLGCVEIWDDRAVRVAHNKGHPLCDGLLPQRPEELLPDYCSECNEVGKHSWTCSHYVWKTAR